MRRRTAVALGLALVAAVLAALGPRLGRAGPEEAVVRRGDLVQTIDLSGTLVAIHSEVLGPPPIADVWEFKIAMLAPEGAFVKRGTPVLGFDASELESRLRDMQAEADKAAKELEKRTTDLELARGDDALKLAEARARLRRARLELESRDDVVAVPHQAVFTRGERHVVFRAAAAGFEPAVPGVLAALPKVRIDPWKVLAAGARTEARVLGVAPDHLEAVHLELAEGRSFDARDEREHAQVCVIGPAVRRDLFGFAPALGRPLRVNDLWLEVVGVLAPRGGGSDSFEGVAVGSPEREIYLPVSTALGKLDRDPLDSPLAEIVVRLAPGTPPGPVAAMIGGLLDRLHGGAEDYEIIVPEALLAQRRRTQRLFDLVMASIAGISLLVGGIGIVNIMLASVLERTREIGTRRALGARQADVRFQFLAESFAISLLGGGLGVAMGLLIAASVSAWAGWPTVVTGASILLSTGVSMAVGLVSGLYPAARAARLDPIEALRYE